MKIELDAIKKNSLEFCLVPSIIKSKMSARHHLSAYNCGRAVGQLEACQSVTTVAAALGISTSVISRLKKAAEGENALQKHAGSPCRNTTPLEDCYAAIHGKKEQKFHSWPDNCKPYNCYRTLIRGHTEALRLRKLLNMPGMLLPDMFYKEPSLPEQCKSSKLP